MKLSVDTVNILKNFSLINPSIAFKAGNSLSTMSPQRSVMARADLDDHFPSDGAIYDLSRFLGVISLFETPEAVLRAANIMQLPEIAVSGGRDITLEAINSGDPTSDRYTQVLGLNETNHNFTFIFKADNMKVMSYDYNCKITQKGISQFTSCNVKGPKITYWIAVEQNSEFT